MEGSKTRGTVMMAVGLAMIFGAVGIAFVLGQPLPVTLGAVGLVFTAIGARDRRAGAGD